MYMSPEEFISRSIQMAEATGYHMSLSKKSILVAGQTLLDWHAQPQAQPFTFQHQFFTVTVEAKVFHEMLSIYANVKDEDNHVYDACMIVSKQTGSAMAHWVGDEPAKDDHNMTLFKMMTYDCLKLTATI